MNTVHLDFEAWLALATVLTNPLLGLVAGTCAEIVRKIIVSKRKIRRE